jgi:hypothetical protein
LNWAGIVAKPPLLKRSTNEEPVAEGLTDELDALASQALAPDDDEFLRESATGQKISWADYCDSD